MKIPVEQIFIFVQLLAHSLPPSATANLCQQAIFFHDTQNCLGVVVNPFAAFQPLPHPSVTVGVKAFCLLLPDCFGKSCILFRSVHSFDIAVIAASGHCKESAHSKHRIFLPVAVDYCVFYFCSHFLSVDRRKSRSNSFSILNRLISYACSAIISPGAESFRGRPFGRGVIPASIFACLWLYRLIQFLICDLLNPNRSAISCRVAPPCRILRISCSNACICVYFLRDIRTPPV